MRNLILSPSSLDTLSRCPREFFFQYILNRTTVEINKHFLIGEYLHYILEQYYLQRKKRETDLDKVIELARYKAVTMVGLTIEETEELIKLFLQYQEFHFNETWEIEEAEKPFTKVLWEDEKIDLRIVVKGKIDLLIQTQGIPVIVDHKKISQNKTPSPRANQILAYCWAVERKDFIINQLGTQKTLKPIDKFKRHYFNIPSHQIDEWIEQTIYSCFEVVRYSEKKFWPGRLSSCANPITGSRCIFHEVCGSGKDNWDLRLSDTTNYQTRQDHDLMGTEVE